MNLIKIWNNKSKIIEGLKNSIFKTKYIEEIAEERMSICNSCEFLDKEGSRCVVPGTQPCCGKCGCSLHLKLRSLSSDCGDEINPKWKAVLTQEEEDGL